MLHVLTLRDLALIEHAEIELGPGLNVITGETGAGKSLLVQAADLLIGGRAAADIVREGAARASVQGEFRLDGAAARAAAALLESWNVDFDGETVIVRREVHAGGKSRATVNQSAVTLAALQQLGELLADLHGQHEHQSLLRAGAGVDTLDRLGGLGTARERFVTALAAEREARAERERIEAALRSYEERSAWLDEAAREIDDARLEEGEEERLKAEAARMAHADRLRERVAQALARLADEDGAAAAALDAAAHALEQAAAIDPALEPPLAAIEEARIASGEAARALTEYVANLDVDPGALEAIESRREAIARLTRKHRRGVPELIAWREELRAELALGANGTEALDTARAAEERTAAACRRAGRELSRARQAAAREWSAKLSRELAPLGFPSASLEFTVTPIDPTAEPPRAHGFDDVEMQFRPNPGEPPRPLRRIASGGELSRVMLALKSALQAQDPVDVVIFDEIDTGIGGAVAQAVGARLERLARHRQVLCVTHLPMIAAVASRHLRVTKRVVAQRTSASIEPLDGEARIEEIARMLAGTQTTETTRKQARELLVGARP